MGEVYQHPRRPLWPSRLAAVYNAATAKPPARRTKWNTCGTRAELELNVIGEEGFLMLDPLGQGVLCG
jgi:hypothetical protein